MGKIYVKLQGILLCSLYKRGKKKNTTTLQKCFINILNTSLKIWVFDLFLTTL